MNVPRVRFTVRRLMVAVAVAAIGFGSIAWVIRMRTLSADYRRRAKEFERLTFRIGSTVKTPDGRLVNPHDDENNQLRNAWAWPLAARYLRLSYYPWLAVEPDPPPPERLARPRSALDLPEPDHSLARWYYGSPPPPWTFLWTGRW
jgi:hypothetical protein